MTIRWLYPTSASRKIHAFLGERVVRDASLGDDVEQGRQSLCRKYGRYDDDHGRDYPGIPKDACIECVRRAAKRGLV